MTVRIIKKKPAASVVKRIACGDCGVTLEYVPKDIQERHGTDYGGGPDGCKYIICPNCNEWIILQSW